MYLDNLNKWLTLLANLGVLAGIIFLAIEIGQNTAAINRQAANDRISRVMAPYIRDIPEIYEKIKVVDGAEPTIERFKSIYSLNTQEAVSWAAFLQTNWRAFETDFVFIGPTDELRNSIEFMLVFPDNQIYWDDQKSTFDFDFVNYVDHLVSSN